MMPIPLHRAGQRFRVSSVESGGLVEADSALDIAGDHTVRGEHMQDIRVPERHA